MCIRDRHQGSAMSAYVAHDESSFAPPAEVAEAELYHPKTFIGKYVWSQDAKVIAIQYALTAIGIVLTALFLGGFGNYLIPLMVGARDMVFPYVNMLSYWLYLLAVILLVVSFFVPGGPTGAGWTLYPPQAILDGTPGAQW